MTYNCYPLTTRTYFATESHAWRFAEYIGANLSHTIVSDYGIDPEHDGEPYWVETIEDPFRTKHELMRSAGLAH